MRVLMFISFLSMAVLAHGQSTTPKPVVTILGVYHLHNPGNDKVNVDAGDILSFQRQQEIRKVLQVVKQFRPTKIAIEMPYGDTLWGIINYQLFLKNQLEKDTSADTRRFIKSEVVQVAYRLAKQLGHKQLYPIDAQTSFNMDSVIRYGQENGQRNLVEELENFAAKLRLTMDSASRRTVLDILKFINSDRVSKGLNQTFYLKHLIAFGKENTYIGADAVAEWYARNLRIFSNLHRIIGPQDRVLVIYGAGHKEILEDLVKDRVDWAYEDINQYLGK